MAMATNQQPPHPLQPKTQKSQQPPPTKRATTWKT